MSPTSAAATTRMRAEIDEQPQALARTLATVGELRPALRALRDRVDRVVFFARGSSDNVGVYGRYLCELVAGLPASMGAPSVATLYARSLDLNRTLVVLVSQSGRTLELVELAAWATRCGATTVAVTNDGASPLATGCDIALVTEAGSERAVPATKTVTTAMLAVAALVECLAGEPAELRRSLPEVPEQAGVMLGTADDAARLAGRLAPCSAAYVVGRGLSLSNALELALKVEETCALTAVGMSYADLQHGPLAVVGAGPGVLVTAGPAGPTLAGLTELAATARAAGAPTLGIGGDAAFRDACDDAVAGPALPETLAPIAALIPGQLLVERLARLLDRDPDAPAGLTKVTQTS